MISLIVAMSDHNVIGKDGSQPVYISADLKRFKELTTGHTVIMGRKTFQAILDRLGKPLPNRLNIVISHIPLPGEGYTVARSLDEALRHTRPNEEAFVIGGGSVYEQTFDQANRIYLTRIDADLEGDVFFPEINPAEWREAAREDFAASDTSPYPYSWITLERRRD